MAFKQRSSPFAQVLTQDTPPGTDPTTPKTTKVKETRKQMYDRKGWSYDKTIKGFKDNKNNNFSPEITRNSKNPFTTTPKVDAEEVVEEQQVEENIPFFEQMGNAFNKYVIGTSPVVKYSLNKLKNNLSENLNPKGYGGGNEGEVSYSEVASRVGKAAFNIDDPENRKDGNIDSTQMTERKALLNKTLRQPYDKSILPPSNYKPTSSKDPNATYVKSLTTENDIRTNNATGSLKDHWEAINKRKDPDKPDKPGSWTAYHSPDKKDNMNVLGHYTQSAGIDENGRKYVAYYDTWDLQPFGKDNIGSKIFDGMQRAAGVDTPEVYGRVYVDEFYNNTITNVSKEIKGKGKENKLDTSFTDAPPPSSNFRETRQR